MTPPFHLPVLLDEVINAFSPLSIKIIVDGTVGAGGHAAALLQKHPEITHYIGIDQDTDALAIAAKTLKPWKGKVFLKHGNFCDIESILKSLSIGQVDAILVDLGVSSMQLDRPERGFSFMRDGPLDMRMNRDSALTAATIVNEWSEKELGRIFRDYGEEKKWRLAAQIIVQKRKESPILTTAQLVEVLKSALGGYSKKGMNPATLIFQALRIAVNKELDVLETFLKKAIKRLNVAGRLAVISFHSLEDRLVKNESRFAASDKWNTSGIGGMFQDKEPTIALVTKKPLVATEEECKINPRSRCAKLRVIEKLENSAA